MSLVEVDSAEGNGGATASLWVHSHPNCVAFARVASHTLAEPHSTATVLSTPCPDTEELQSERQSFRIKLLR